MVHDGEENCPDGSDEDKSSFWTSDDDTRAEKYKSMDGVTAMILIAIVVISGCVSMVIPRLIFDRLIKGLSVEDFERDFNEKHQPSIQIAYKLINKQTKITQRIDRLNFRKRSIESKRKELISTENELELVLNETEALSSSIQKANTDIETLIEKIDQHWDSIKDLVPYGKILL